MKYDTLYEAWLREKENEGLQKLPKDFYDETAEYIKRIRRETRMLESTSLKARLITQELANAKRMAEELVALRFEKLVRQTRTGDPPSNEALASEEEEVALDLRGSVEKFRKVLADSVRGRKAESGEETGQDKKVLRFLKEVPAIVGADLKIYGPFVAEDVATLPAENARALVKHGAAMEVETG